MTISMHGLKLDGIVWNHRSSSGHNQGPPLDDRERSFQYISDHMDATWHPVTGEVLDSKSRFREITRAHGCVEVGNEVQSPPERPRNSGAGEAVKRALEQLRSR